MEYVDDRERRGGPESRWPRSAAGRGWRISLAAILGLLCCGCEQADQPALVRQAPIVTVAHPSQMEIVFTKYFEGYTAAVATVEVRARVTGYLTKVYFKDGAEVKEGTPLFLIDPRPYQATFDEAEANRDRAKVALKRADLDLARAEKLLPNRTISQEEFDRTAANRSEAAADLKAREAALAQADLNLHFAAIKAPIAGRISRTQVTEGNLVSANDTLLTTIVAIRPIYAYFDVDELTVLQIEEAIREGRIEASREARLPIQLALDINQGYPYQGVMDFVETRVDPNTGTLKVRAVFANEDGALLPGLHARIKLMLGKPQSKLVIPERAIGTTQGRKFVYLVNAKNEVVERPITLGHLQDQMRVVTEGLTLDDRIIVNGLQRVRPGVTVEPKQAEVTPPAASAPKEVEPKQIEPAAAGAAAK